MILWIALLLCIILMVVSITMTFVIMAIKGWAYWTCVWNALAMGILMFSGTAYCSYKINSGDPRWKM